jgi:hypothetical protein
MVAKKEGEKGESGKGKERRGREREWLWASPPQRAR